MRKNRCLNFFKGLACLGVVLIHARFPGLLGETIKRAALWCVPIFYMISGYYCYHEDSNTTLNKIPKKIKNIAKITLLGCLLYFCFSLLNEIRKGELLIWFTEIVSWKNILNLVILNDFDFIHAPHFWFLLSLIYCYLLLYLVIKKNKVNIIYILIPILYLMRILIPYIPNYNWHYQENVFLNAIPCFFSGYLIANYPETFLKITNKQALIIIILGTILNMLVTSISLKLTIDIFEILTILISFAIFIYAVKNSDKYFSKIIETIGNRYSLFIYILHLLIVDIITIIAQLLHIDNCLIYLYGMPFVVIIITLLSIFILEKIINRTKYKLDTKQ